MPQGKALDLYEASPIAGNDSRIIGATTYEPTANSDVVIVTAGVARKPGMSRDDLININTGIVKTVAENVAQHSPKAVMIIVSNPLDAMVYVAWKASGLPTKKVIGQAGVLDAARYRTFLAMEIGCSVEDVQALLLGGHGDDMVPLKRYTFAGGIPVTQLVKPDRLEAIIDRARKGGAEIVGLLKTGSAYYAPAAATVQMAEAIIRDKKRILPAAAYCDKEYGIGGYFVGVPCVLGTEGVEKVIEIELDDAERKAFQTSVDHVKDLVKTVKL
jgi:malate dehydrogenase